MDWNEVRTKCFILVVGFLLTGVIGAFLGFELRNQSEEHSWLLKRLDYHVSRADHTRERVAKNLDKRMYAMWRLFEAIKIKDKEKSKLEYKYYDDAVKEWNENLNQNLSSVYITFPEAYEMLSYQIQEQGFFPLGKKLENLYQDLLNENAEGQNDKTRITEMANELTNINDKVYRLNVLIEERYEAIMDTKPE